MVKVREGNEESIHYFTDEEDLRDFAGENRDLRLFGEATAGGGRPKPGRTLRRRTGRSDRAARVLYELHESHVDRQAARRSSTEKGFDIEHFFSLGQAALRD